MIISMQYSRIDKAMREQLPRDNGINITLTDNDKGTHLTVIDISADRYAEIQYDNTEIGLQMHNAFVDVTDQFALNRTRTPNEYLPLCEAWVDWVIATNSVTLGQIEQHLAALINHPELRLIHIVKDLTKAQQDQLISTMQGVIQLCIERAKQLDLALSDRIRQLTKGVTT